jgi:hypothetical protein
MGSKEGGIFYRGGKNGD